MDGFQAYEEIIELITSTKSENGLKVIEIEHELLSKLKRSQSVALENHIKNNYKFWMQTNDKIKSKTILKLRE